MQYQCKSREDSRDCWGTTLPIFRTTHHKLAELEDQFKVASVTMRIVLLLEEEAVPQHSLLSLLASSSNLTGLDSFFFKKLDRSVSC